MKNYLLNLTIIILGFIATPAFAVSQQDIDLLFEHPPIADGKSINTLLNYAESANTPTYTPQTLGKITPPQPNTINQASLALTTTNPTPAIAPQKATNLENMFDTSYTEAEEAVSAALAQRGIADKIGAMIDGRKNAAIFSYSEPLQVQTRGLQVDKEHSRWSASLTFSKPDGTVVSAIPATGHFNEVIEIPVLKRAMRNGQIIAQDDIELRDFAASQTRSETVSDLSSLIGKTPLHSVSPYRPIRDAEIINMPILKRDAIVQINYTVPGMQITTSGQAMAGGAKGDVIEVRNTTSKKIVRAVIQSSNNVQVLSTDTQTTQLTQ